jgi:hypothetical protein
MGLSSGEDSAGAAMSKYLAATAIGIAMHAGGCTHPIDGNPPLAWGCGDLVVEADLDTQGYTGDSGWKVDYGGTLRVARVLRGKVRARELKVSYTSHAEIRNDRFIYVLTPQEGGYTLRSLVVPRGNRISIAKTCDPALD